MLFKIKVLILGAALIIVVACAAWLHLKDDKGLTYKRPTYEDYVAIEELIIREVYTGCGMSLEIDFIDNSFDYLAQDTEDIDGAFTFTNDDKEELILLLEENKFLEWLDRHSVAEKKRGNGEERTSLPLEDYDYYLGVGERETRYRFESGPSIEYKMNSEKYWLFDGFDETHSFSEDYNKLLDGLWEIVNRYDIKASSLCIADWRETAIRRSNPDMGQEKPGIPDYDKIWYFSINEFFGGYHYGPGATFVYDASAGSLSYRTWPLLAGLDRTINYVDEDGTISKYVEEDDWWANRWLEQPGPHGISSILPVTDEGKDRLVQILEKYDVSSWGDAEYNQKQLQPAYVKEGGYFCWNPDVFYEEVDKLEHDVRSSYKGIIYLYDTDGRRLTLFYDNQTGLPESYNNFRQEIWDFEMEFIEENERLRSEYSEPDWRKLLSQWGEFYLKALKEKGAGD